MGRRAILEEGPRRNSNILCLLLSHLHLAWEVSPSEVSYETVEPSQHCNILTLIYIWMIKLPLHNFLHWPILLNFLEICYGPLMLRCEHRRRKKNQRTWFHFTPKCNLLKGLGTVILVERKIRNLLEYLFLNFFFYKSQCQLLSMHISLSECALMPSEPL